MEKQLLWLLQSKFSAKAGYPSRRGRISKHAYMGRVLYHTISGNRNRYYHATKGWRSRKL